MDLNLSDYIKHPEKLDKETLPRLEKLVHAIAPDCFLIVSRSQRCGAAASPWIKNISNVYLTFSRFCIY